MKQRSKQRMRVRESRIWRWRRADCEQEMIIASDDAFPSPSSFLRRGGTSVAEKLKRGVLNYEG